MAVVLGWNLVQDVRLGSPWTPPLLGARGRSRGGRRGARRWARPRWRGLASRRRVPAPGLRPVLVAVVVGVLLAPVRERLPRALHERLALAAPTGRSSCRWFLDQPGFEDEDGMIGIASRGVIAQLAGDRFNQRLVLVPQHASCREVERLARQMPVVVTPPALLPRHARRRGLHGAPLPRRARPVLNRDPFYVYRLPASAIVARSIPADGRRSLGDTARLGTDHAHLGQRDDEAAALLEVRALALQELVQEVPRAARGSSPDASRATPPR